MPSILKGMIAAVTIGTAVVALPATGAAQAEYRWTLTTFVPEGNQLYQDYVGTFAERVTQLTDGRVEVVGHGVGILSGPFDAYEAVQQGRADLAFSVPYYLVNQHPANAILGGMIAGMGAEATLNWLFAGGGEEMWTEFRRETTGLEPIIAGAGPTEIFAHARVRIENLEDLDGLKFRASGAWGQMLQEFGASPTSIAPAELFTALERGVVDAAEYANPGTNVSAGLQEAAPFVIVPGVHAPASLYEVVIRGDVWDGLPDDLKVKLKAAGRLAAFESLTKSYTHDLEAIQAIRNSPTEIVELSPEFLDEVRKVAGTWVEQHIEDAAEGDDWLQRMWASYTDFETRWNDAAPFRWNPARIEAEEQ